MPIGQNRPVGGHHTYVAHGFAAPLDREEPRLHSPLFYPDEQALPVGMRALANLAGDYLFDHARGVSDAH